MRRLQPAAQFGGGHHLRAPDALLAPELRAAPPEHDEEQPDQPAPAVRPSPALANISSLIRSRA